MKRSLSVFFIITIHFCYSQNDQLSNDSIAIQKLNFLNWKGSTKSYTLPNYYIPSLGFFCKKELEIQKISVIPIKFRLGSQQNCDLQEGK